MNVEDVMFCWAVVAHFRILFLCAISRLGSFGREHAPVKEKHKKDKERHKDHKDKTGKDKSPHGDVVLRSSFSWDSSQGELRYA